MDFGKLEYFNLPSLVYSSTVFFSPTLKPSVLVATKSSSPWLAILEDIRVYAQKLIVVIEVRLRGETISTGTLYVGEGNAVQSLVLCANHLASRHSSPSSIYVIHTPLTPLLWTMYGTESSKSNVRKFSRNFNYKQKKKRQ